MRCSWDQSPPSSWPRCWPTSSVMALRLTWWSMRDIPQSVPISQVLHQGHDWQHGGWRDGVDEVTHQAWHWKPSHTLVDCGQEDWLLTGLGALLEQSVISEEEFKQKNNFKEDSMLKAELAHLVQMLRFKLPWELSVMRRPKLNIEPFEKQSESGHVLLPPSLVNADNLAPLNTSYENLWCPPAPSFSGRELSRVIFSEVSWQDI